MQVCAAKLLEEITEEVEQYEGVCHQLAYDRIVQLWDSRTYEYDEERGPPVVSAQGKYMGVPLRHMDLGQSHLHVSVHLPLKRNRNAACQLLQEYLEDNQEHYNYIHIHGDFNSDRHVLQDRFAALHPTFAFDAVTTRAGRKLDNVVSLWDKTIFGIGRRSYFRKSINKIMKLSSAKFPLYGMCSLIGNMHYEYMGLPYTTSLGRVDYGEVAIYWMNMRRSDGERESVCHCGDGGCEEHQRPSADL